MSTSVDSLKVGDWVAVVGDRNDCQCGECPLAAFSGKPYLITVISLPFVCVYNGCDTEAFDVRNFDLQKVSKLYVKHRAYVPEPPPQKKLAASSGPPYCIQCGKSLRLYLSDKQYKPKGAIVCPRCGNDAGVVA